MKPLRNRICDDNDIVVSIICNTFNHSKYIRKALDSFLDQKVCFNVEILIHDDCSTDDTVSIIEEYRKQYPNIINPIYEKINLYSKGIDILSIQSKRIKGKYVAICEGDDYWIDDKKLLKQVKMLDETNNKICLHKVVKIDSTTGKTIELLPELDLATGSIKVDKFLNIVTKKYSFQTSSYLLKSDEFKKMYLSNLKFVKLMPTGDEAILLYFSSISEVSYINEAMSVYRIMSKGSWSEKYSLLSNKEIANHKKRCYFAYKEFDNFTSKQYHNILSRRIYDYKWAYLFLSKRYISLFFHDPRGVLSMIRNHFKK